MQHDHPTIPPDPPNPSTSAKSLPRTEVFSTGNDDPGDMIGPYRLLEILGEGGFGTVWLAERREPFAQRVAVKIIKAGMDTKAVIARFEQERQALAVMDHPNVAKVFDAGTTSRGRPYFVMEAVAGEPITRYCDKRRLTIRQRLELFIPVCEAVQHAHHKGIIHRDLKPSNILVTSRDDLATPKVIDFGVAKAMTRSLTEKTIYTEQGQMIGTPEYMSPEQADMRGTDVDTRSDVYSLGAVLYELLTGEVPFASHELRSAGIESIRQMIRELDPPKPSTRLSVMNADVSATVAEHRHAERAELASELKRELDWIPLKALRKHRAERYDSPADLARDIRNYLEGRALEAGPVSAAYRFRKLVHRRRGLVAAGVAVAAALVLGMAGFAWQAQRIAVERDATAAERDRARAVTDFVVKSLKLQDPSEQGRQDMTVAEAMAQAMRGLDAGELKDQPGQEALVLRTIAEVLNRNGRSAEAERPASRAMELELAIHSGDHADVAASLDMLAFTQRSLGRLVEAERLSDQSLAMRRRLYPGDHPDVAKGLTNLALAQGSLGRLSEAESLYAEALAMNRRLYQGDHPAISSSLNNLATARESLGRAAEAEPLHVEALEMHKRLFPGDHPATASSMNNLAVLRASLGRLQEAEVLYEQALAMRRRLYKGDHPDIAGSLSGLGSVHNAMGRGAEAEPLYVEALEMTRRLFKGDHPDIARGLNNLASLRQSLGRAAEAEPLLRQSVDMCRRLYPGDHPNVATAMSNLARCLVMLERWSEAHEMARQASEIAMRTLPAGHTLRKKCDALLSEIAARLAKDGSMPGAVESPGDGAGS